MRPLTHMHLAAARLMPPRRPPLALGDARKDAAWARRLKAERRAIAAYYRAVRGLAALDYGPAAARTAHRYAVVRTAAEAKARLRHLTPTEETRR